MLSPTGVIELTRELIALGCVSEGRSGQQRRGRYGRGAGVRAVCRVGPGSWFLTKQNQTGAPCVSRLLPLCRDNN